MCIYEAWIISPLDKALSKGHLVMMVATGCVARAVSVKNRLIMFSHVMQSEMCK